MKNKKTIIIVIVIIVLLVLAYFGWRAYKINKRQQALKGVSQGGTTPSGTTSGGMPSYSDAFPLKMGSRGNNVTALQYAINEGCPEVGEKIKVDGIFGPQTEAASNICLGTQPGHVNGQVSYAEYQWLTKRISFAQEQQIKQGCQASLASRQMMLAFWGIDCASYGY